MARKIALNTKEQKVYDAFEREPESDRWSWVTIEDLARRAFVSQRRGVAPDTQGNSWVRNSLRKLLKLGLVKHGGSKSGKYARTEVDIKALVEKAEREAAATKAAKPPRYPKAKDSTPKASASKKAA